MRTFRRFFLKFCYFWRSSISQTDLTILKTDDKQFTLTMKKSSHIIFKAINFLTRNFTRYVNQFLPRDATMLARSWEL